MENVATIIDLINAGGIVAVLVILVAGFWTGKVLSRRTHDEIVSKQDIVVDRFIEKINGSFQHVNESLITQTKSIDQLVEVNETLARRSTDQTVILRNIENELKKQNAG